MAATGIGYISLESFTKNTEIGNPITIENSVYAPINNIIIYGNKLAPSDRPEVRQEEIIISTYTRDLSRIDDGTGVLNHIWLPGEYTFSFTGNFIQKNDGENENEGESVKIIDTFTLYKNEKNDNNKITVMLDDVTINPLSPEKDEENNTIYKYRYSCLIRITEDNFQDFDLFLDLNDVIYEIEIEDEELNKKNLVLSSLDEYTLNVGNEDSGVDADNIQNTISISNTVLYGVSNDDNNGVWADYDYVDKEGKYWICDTIDKAAGKYIQRIQWNEEEDGYTLLEKKDAVIVSLEEAQLIELDKLTTYDDYTLIYSPNDIQMLISYVNSSRNTDYLVNINESINRSLINTNSDIININGDITSLKTATKSNNDAIISLNSYNKETVVPLANNVYSWLTFSNDALRLQKRDSEWYTEMRADGFYINNTAVAGGVVGRFYKNTLEVNNMNFTYSNENNNSSITMTASPNGGVIWI